MPKTYPLKIFIFQLMLICCFFYKHSISQSLHVPISSAVLNLSAKSQSQSNPFSFPANTASLQQVQETVIGFYGERRYMLNELSNYSLAVVFPTKLGNFGFDVNKFGFSDYNDCSLAFGYAKKINEKIDLGMLFNGQLVKCSATEKYYTLTSGLGFVFHLSERVSTHFQFAKPVSVSTNNKDEKKQYHINAGIGYDVSKEFYLGATLYKVKNETPIVICGMQYQIKKKAVVKYGFIGAFSTMYGGFGFDWKNMGIDISCSFHPQLGITPGMSVTSNFAK